MTDLDEERADLNALIREAHEATKDLKAAQKGLDDRLKRADEIGGALTVLLNQWEQQIANVADMVVTEKVDESLTPIMDRFIEDLQKNMELLKEAITTRTGLYLDSVSLPQDLLSTFTWEEGKG